MLHIYNTLSQQKELFKPIVPNQVKIYVCGLTVYDDCHLGHGRLFIWFDVVVRYLRSLGYQVTYVRNITDIDDKIIKRAQQLQLSCQELTTKIIASMHEDTTTLATLPPDFEPKVTDHLDQILLMINTLIAKGFAYPTSDGDVYYEVAKFQDYGCLAHQDLTQLTPNLQLEPHPEKRAPLDFALWKAAKPNEPAWPAPWGAGRPGWHIECSAMAKAYLGSTFDLHGGGNDLQFPHHQNELAQSEAANGCHFVNYWMHMGFVQVAEEKMSKSLGNFLTLKEVLKTHHPEALRYFIIASHYRSPVNFSEANLENAHAALKRLYIAIKGVPSEPSNHFSPNNEFVVRFHEAMDDDFNTPEALAVLFELARELNKLRSTGQLELAHQYGLTLKYLANILGLLQAPPEKFLQGSASTNAHITALIAERQLARSQKNWPEADRIRQELQALGITLEDTPSGTTWVKL